MQIRQACCFAINHESLNNLAQLLKSYPAVLAGYLYGSRITGHASAKSDLDLALVVDDTECVNYEEAYLKISQIFPQFEIDLRIITQDSSPTYLFQVLNGKRVYERSGLKRIKFEVKALHTYYDTQHIRDIYNLYLKKSLK